MIFQRLWPVFALIITVALLSGCGDLFQKTLSNFQLDSVAVPYAQQQTNIALQDVIWTNALNVHIESCTEINKISGTTDDQWSAGAVSLQTLASGNGYLEFHPGDGFSGKMIGLSKGDTNQAQDDIDFALFFKGDGQVSVYQNGTSTVENVAAYITDDVFRVEVIGADLHFLKNGASFHTLTGAITSASYPLRVDTSFQQRLTAFTEVKLSGFSVGAPNTTTELEPVTWMNAQNIKVSRERLAGGIEFSNAYSNFNTAGAVSEQSIDEDAGLVEFTVGNGGKYTLTLSTRNQLLSVSEAYQLHVFKLHLAGTGENQFLSFYDFTLAPGLITDEDYGIDLPESSQHTHVKPGDVVRVEVNGDSAFVRVNNELRYGALGVFDDNSRPLHAHINVHAADADVGNFKMGSTDPSGGLPDYDTVIQFIPEDDLSVNGQSNIAMISLDDLGSAAQMATAVRSAQGLLRVDTWNISPNGTATRLRSYDGNFVGDGDIALTRIQSANTSTDFVAAFRDTSNQLVTMSFAVDAVGDLALLDQSTVTDSQIVSVDIAETSPVGTYGHALATMRSATNEMQWIAWEVDPNGSFAQLGTFSEQTLNNGTITPSSVFVGAENAEPRFVAVTRDITGSFSIRIWSIDALGMLTLVNTLPQAESDAIGVVGENGLGVLSLNLSQTNSLLVNAFASDNRLKFLPWAITSGGQVQLLSVYEAETLRENQVAVTRLGGIGSAPRLITAIRTVDGNLRLTAWEALSDGTVSRIGDVEAGKISHNKLSLVSLNNSPVTQVVSAFRDETGMLKLRIWNLLLQ